MFHYVHIVYDHPQDPSVVHLDLKPQIVRLPVLESVGIHQGTIDFAGLRVYLKLVRVH